MFPRLIERLEELTSLAADALENRKNQLSLEFMGMKLNVTKTQFQQFQRYKDKFIKETVATLPEHFPDDELQILLAMSKLLNPKEDR